MELTAVPLGLVPLAFASAIVRYRLMDVEGILTRLLVYTAAVSAIVAIYTVIVRTTGVYFVSTEDDHRWVIAALATVVVLLLARPVKDGVQSAIERVLYRDRYDYRRALVGFARELNTDLDLDRLAERLLARVKDTLLVDRLCLMSATGYGAFDAVRSAGFDHAPPPIDRNSAVAARVAEGQVVRLDDPMAVGRLPVEEVEFWRDTGLYYFVPCVSNGRRDCRARAGPPRERRAAHQRRPRAGHRDGRPGGHLDRERAALPRAAREGGRVRPPAGLQRAHSRVARRRPARRRRRRRGDALEPRAGAHLRAAPRRGGGALARPAVRPHRWYPRSSRPGPPRPTAAPSTASRCSRAARATPSCWSTSPRCRCCRCPVASGPAPS